MPKSHTASSATVIKFTPPLEGMDLRMCGRLDDMVNQRIEAKKGQFSRYQICLGDPCMGHREARALEKEVLE